MKIWKFSGIFLTYTGILHTIVALILGKNALLEMVDKGLIDSIDKDYHLEYSFWFLVCGILIILFGLMLHRYIKLTQKPAPLFLGWSLLVFSVVGCLIVPFSGFWLFIPQAFIIIMASRK